MNILIPENLEEIPLGKWQRFEKINKEGSDQDFIMDKVIEIFCDVPLLDVSKIPLSEAKDVFNDIISVLEEKEEFKDVITIKGKDYGFIPNLEDITLGEFVDLDSYLTDPQNLHKAMAVLYRPITRRYKELYDIEKYENSAKYSEIMKECPMSYVTGAVVFFYNLSKELTRLSLHSSLKTIQKEKIIARKDSSLKNGEDGLLQFMPYVKEMLLDLKK